MNKRVLVGGAYAAAAFFFWGINPLYFKLLVEVPPLEVLAHRVIWALPLLALLVAVNKSWRDLVSALADHRTLSLLVLSTMIVSSNWFVYISSIADEQVLQSSLGYYINPLVNILLGVLVLGERLTRWHGVAVALAALGVVNLAIQIGGIPWIALYLAFSFGLYGLIRKRLSLASVEGLFVETALLTPLAFGYLLWLGAEGQFLTGDAARDGLLLLAGVVTAAPLIWFTSGARRLNYSTVGFFQYLSPTCLFLLAVFVFDEPFTRAHLVTFACIWAALLIFTVESIRRLRRA